jgi:putative phosphoribosyl transferase
MRFSNRAAAGILLAEQLKSALSNKKSEQIIVLALPRGGLPVAFEIAKAFHAPLDVFIVRKLGVPGHEELAMGAMASGNVVVFNQDIVRQLSISQAEIQSVIAKELAELKRREHVYRQNKAPLVVENKTVILVDDGIATGATMRAAVMALKKLHPAQLIVAVPVADPHICEEFALLADEVVCLFKPSSLQAVGMWYEDFSQTEDEEVHAILKEAEKNHG